MIRFLLILQYFLFRHNGQDFGGKTSFFCHFRLEKTENQINDGAKQDPATGSSQVRVPCEIQQGRQPGTQVQSDQEKGQGNPVNKQGSRKNLLRLFRLTN